MNSDQLKECSRVLKAETPRIRAKTTDVYPDLNWIDRMTLYYADRQGIKLLNQRNK